MYSSGKNKRHGVQQTIKLIQKCNKQPAVHQAQKTNGLN